MADAARSVEFTYEEGIDLPSVATQRAMNLLRTRFSPPQKEPRPLSVTTSLGGEPRLVAEDRCNVWPCTAALCGPFSFQNPARHGRIVPR